jgi:hypothetical protein
MALDKTLTDINRRDTDLLVSEVEGVLPSHFRGQYPLLIAFLEKYQESQQELEPVSVLSDYGLIRDIVQLREDLLGNIGEEYLLTQSYFENFVDKRKSIELVNLLYRSKGTRYSIEQFFRIFFDVDVDVHYPKVDIFKVGDPKRETLEFTTNGTSSGNNFPFVHEGDLIVKLKSTSGKEIELIEDSDYTLNSSLKNVTLMKNGDITKTRFAGDSDLEFFATTGYGAIGNTLTLDITKSNYSSLGSTSQEKKLQDGALYQLYSLQIRTELSRDIWEDAYQKFMHPAGMYLGSQINILSQYLVDLSNQASNVQSSAEIFVSGTADASFASATQYTDLTGIYPDSATLPAAEGYIRTTLLTDAIGRFDSADAITIDRQYNSVLDAINIRPPTADMDSAGTGLSRDSDSFIDTSNVFDQADQNFYEDSDGLIDPYI